MNLSSVLPRSFRNSNRRPRAVRKPAARSPVQAVPAADPTPDRLMQLAWGYAPTLIVETALKFRVFDLLESRPMTLEELAEQTGGSTRGLRAILNALVGMDLLQRKGSRYRLTGESAKFLVSSKPTYHGTYFTHMTRQLLPGWLRLHHAVQTGKPVVALNQEQAGERFFAEFVESLYPLNYQAARKLGELLEIPKAQARVSVLDIGAGSGVWGIALAHLSSQVLVHAVDWPEVLAVTRRVAVREGVADRVRTSAGDLLKANLGRNHHVAIVGHILHTEGPERSQELLRRAYEAMAPGGTICIAEFIPNEERTGPANSLIFAVNMLIHTEQGDTFTFSEISKWLASAGFLNPRLVEAPAPSPLVLATRPG